MRETNMDQSENELSVGKLPTSRKLTSEQENGTDELIQGLQSERSLQSLSSAGLTSIQQLHKSGNLLTKSMTRVVESESDFIATEVVELAKALAETVQTQANLLKVLKEFVK